MKTELRHQFRIESARFLPHLAENHPCRRIHGHSFLITIVVRGKVDTAGCGWLIDFNDLAHKGRAVLDPLDHRLLNEIPGLENPTSEIMCQFIYERLKKDLPELYQIIIQETPETECRYPVE